MATIDDLKQTRTEKLEALREMGVDPYPASVTREHTIAHAREVGEQAVSIAGRVTGMRGHGKIYFLDLYDGTGTIQVVCKQNECDTDAYKLLTLTDLGDFLAAQGTVGKTQAGEISVFASSLQMITKAVRPLPSTWHGLKDVEERYRKRYLDMILNSDVTRRLQMRSKIITAIRNLLDAKGFLEVETPTLQPIYGGGFARPFVTHHNVLDADFYLRISDEMYLKRLIVGGLEKVYEITKVFRNEGIDHDHNPEFTMFEAQIAYEDYTYGMDIVEEIFEHCANEALGTTEFEYQGTNMSLKRPWKRYRLVEAIREFTGVDPMEWKTTDQAKAAIMGMDIKESAFEELHKMATIGQMIAFAFEEAVEEKLIQPTIIYDYPIEISPLAKKCEDPRFTQRFELFAFGSELGNNYSELNDPVDLARRFIEEKKREEAGFDEAHQTDYDYLTAIEHGFPPTCGLGIGIDRMVMLLTDAKSIKETIAFPTLRPKIEAETGEAGEIAAVHKPEYFSIQPEVKKAFPSVSVGIALIEGVTVKDTDDALEAKKAALVEELSSLTTADISTFPEIVSYRSLYKQMGVDWHSRRPSPEALLRRVAQGKGLYTVNTCVDAYNLVVMRRRISAGAFDADQIEFPTNLRFAGEGDEILLLGDKEPTVYQPKELAYYDKTGGFNIDFNYRDAQRTLVTQKTKNIWINVDGVFDITPAKVQAALNDVIETILMYCGGSVAFSGVVQE